VIVCLFVGDVRSGGGDHSDRHKEVDGLLALPVRLCRAHMRDPHRSSALDRRRIPPFGPGNTPLAVVVDSRPVLVRPIRIRLHNVLCHDTRTWANGEISLYTLFTV
jgi:hypothetical protein